MGVGFAALQRNAHGHLTQRAAGQAIGPAEGLRAEQHVDPERTALPHQPVHQQPAILGDLVVLDEEFLKFVDDQQDSRHRLVRLGLPIAVQILHAEHRGTYRRGGCSSASKLCSTLRPNSRSLSMAITRACGSSCVA